MSEFLDACVALVNLPYTSLLILVTVYWLTVIIGLIDTETIDIDLHKDVDLHVGVGTDADVHAHVEAGTDAGFMKDVNKNFGDHLHKDTGSGSGGFFAMLHYFNVGEVPLMVLVSVLAFSMWFISMSATHALSLTSIWIAIPLFVPILILSAFIAKFTTSPLRALYKTLEKDSFEEVSVVGRLCKVKTGTVNEQFGQAEVIREQEGVPLLINVRTRNGETLKKDEEGVVLEYLEQEDSYVITSLETE